MFGGVITTLLLFALVTALILYNKRKTQLEGQDFDRNEIIGEYGIETLIFSILLLWIIHLVINHWLWLHLRLKHSLLILWIIHLIINHWLWLKIIFMSLFITLT